jgi:hypothetical protein
MKKKQSLEPTSQTAAACQTGLLHHHQKHQSKMLPQMMLEMTAAEVRASRGSGVK